MKSFQCKLSIIRRFIFLLICGFLLISQIACENDPYYGRRPINQRNSVWYCEEFDIRFIVNDEGFANGTIRNLTDRIPYTIIWSAVSNHAEFVKNYTHTALGQKYDVMFDGTCEFSENDFIFQVVIDDEKLFGGETPPTLEFSKIDSNVSFHDFLGKSYVWNAEETLKSVKEKFLAFQPEMNDIALAIAKRNSSTSLHFDQGVLTSSDGKSDGLPQGIDEQLEICKPLLNEFDSVHLAFGKSLEDGALMFSKTLVETSRIFNRYVFVILSYSPQIPDTGEEIYDGWYIKIYSAV